MAASVFIEFLSKRIYSLSRKSCFRLFVCLFVCFQQAEAIRESHHYPLGAHAQLINLQLTPYA